ncbi:hypothetical protein M419DRAFT_140636 [Trichoderma reesei RUT C-30]|uniref:Uncharacterized protein n=1 Tax=Hypocrea jecorina (strain ATCC 56765 / BCRC 32924 / NRRL 11460 / Rut C-30) TaxID=1344414 RepID=A0A024SH15_HYPJR|nr:hypothetical protein M419DRAFT_140636 [Trichoderma reesei RUT C-30]
MAPTSKPEKRRPIPKVDTEHNFDTNARHFQAATSDGVDIEGQLKRALVGLPGQGEEVDANADGPPESLPFISLPYLPPPSVQPSDLAERGPIATLVPILDTDTVAAPAAAPPPKPSFKTIFRPDSKPTSTSTPKRPVYTMGSILPKGTATGVAGNFQSASVRPQRTTLSAALPKATDVDSDSDSDESVDSDDSLDSDDEDGDDAESDDEDKEDDGKASAGKSSKSPVASSTATRPAITSPILANQRAGVTGIPETTTSKGITGGEKAAIAVATIGFVVVLLAMGWFYLRRIKRKPVSKPVWPPNFPSGDSLADGTRRVSSKFSDKFLSLRDRIKPGASGWSSLDDGTVYDNDKSPILEASDAKAKQGKRRATLSRVMVNPYGMVFRKPRHDSTWSDIMVPKGEKAPPMPSSPAASLARASVMSEKIPPMPPMPASVMSPTTSVSSLTISDRQAAAAAHLETARKSVTASLHNKALQTPLRRNTHMSDVSSLSSGFGDGDIIITPPTAAVAMKSGHPGVADSHVNLVAVRGSEGASLASQAAGSRDTVYTSVSDDSRPHFRPVSAWVRQQSRRAKKAVPSDENGIPAVPDAPMEQGFDLMMPDEQEPRRVESSMWKDKKGGNEMA